MSRKRTKWVWITYDSDWDRWAVVMDGLTFDLHCGECFRMKIAGCGFSADWNMIETGM